MQIFLYTDTNKGFHPPPPIYTIAISRSLGLYIYSRMSQVDVHDDENDYEDENINDYYDEKDDEEERNTFNSVGRMIIRD